MQISEHLHALKIPFQIPLGPGRFLDRFVYVYFLCGQREVVLVDSGVAGAERAIFDALRAAGREPGQISRIVQTHAHPDHIGATRAIQQATGCAVLCHARERHWIEDVDVQMAERPVPGFRSLVGGSASVDGLLGDGDALLIDGQPIGEVLHTPGHSPGSISLWFAAERTVVSGDAILLPGGTPIYDDIAQCVASLARLEGLDAQVVLSAWDEPRRDAAALWDQSRGYLRRIHETTLAVAAEEPSADLATLCRLVVERLELPPAAANPLVGRSLASSLTGLDGRRCSAS